MTIIVIDIGINRGFASTSETHRAPRLCPEQTCSQICAGEQDLLLGPFVLCAFARLVLKLLLMRHCMYVLVPLQFMWCSAVAQFCAVLLCCAALCGVALLCCVLMCSAMFCGIADMFCCVLRCCCAVLCCAVLLCCRSGLRSRGALPRSCSVG